MNNFKMFCICIHNDLLKNVRALNYIPVGLGSDNFSSGWLKDDTGQNISYKNKFYGEYTFHYWFWKNKLDEIEDNTWIGFCAYRRFWLKDKIDNKNSDLKKRILTKIPEIWGEYDVIIGDQIKINDIPWIKILKYGKKSIIKNPKAIFKKNRNIKFHFDMFHGNNILDKAIDQLGNNDKDDFKKFVNTRHSYNQGNMFICKSKSIMSEYYSVLFTWLKNCEQVFGFDLKGYGKIRIYTFLAERFLPYWFSKNTNYLEWPIIFKDLREEKL